MRPIMRTGSDSLGFCVHPSPFLETFARRNGLGGVTRRGWGRPWRGGGAAEVDLDGAPSSTSGGRKARAMPCPSIGREVAAGDLADHLAVDQHGAAVPGRPAALDQQPPQPPATPRSRSASSAARPRNGALLPADHPTQPGLQRRDARAELVAVQRQPGLEPERVARAQPGGREPRRQHRVPERGRRVGRHRHLHAVLTRVAGARHHDRHALPLDLGHAAPTDQRSPSRRRARPGADGPCNAMTARSPVTSDPPMASTTRDVFDAFGITSNRSSPTHQTMMSSSTEPSASSSRCVYCVRPGGDLRQVGGQRACSASNAPAPPPARSRGGSRRRRPRRSGRPGARPACRPGTTAASPSPPNGTIFAPRARWAASSGECPSARSGCAGLRGRGLGDRRPPAGPAPRPPTPAAAPSRASAARAVPARTSRSGGGSPAGR